MKKKDDDYSKEQLNSHKLQKREFMNSHVDIQKHDKQKWLSLTEYSQKHNVSISTLRRRIRSGTITVKLEEGKYFIVDGQQNNDLLQDQSTNESSKEFFPLIEDTKQNSFIDKLLITQQELYRLLAEKDKKIESLQTQISDFNTLVALLEKENSQMKSQIEQEKKLEEWLNK